MGSVCAICRHLATSESRKARTSASGLHLGHERLQFRVLRLVKLGDGVACAQGRAVRNPDAVDRLCRRLVAEAVAEVHLSQR
eukprot:1021724-Prymnesium_polylepis.1